MLSNKRKANIVKLLWILSIDSLKRSDSKEPCVCVSAQQQSCRTVLNWHRIFFLTFFCIMSFFPLNFFIYLNVFIFCNKYVCAINVLYAFAILWMLTIMPIKLCWLRLYDHFGTNQSFVYCLVAQTHSARILGFRGTFLFIPTHSLFLFASLRNMWKKKTHTHTHTNAHKAAAIPGLNKRAHSNPPNAHSATSVALYTRTRAFIAPKINPAPRKVRFWAAQSRKSALPWEVWLRHPYFLLLSSSAAARARRSPPQRASLTRHETWLQFYFCLGNFAAMTDAIKHPGGDLWRKCRIGGQRYHNRILDKKMKYGRIYFKIFCNKCAV